MTKQNELQNLKGFRDFFPKDARKRDYLISKLRSVFEKHGFEPIETPVLEYASVLKGKYGKEADKLIYTFQDHGKRSVGMRYDQTVPTARFLSQNRSKLPKYFRRYQIQNVYRAENTQKGRYREFLQCDCDLFGAKNNISDAEILSVFFDVYKTLGVKSFKIILNDRQTLFNIFNDFATEKLSSFSIIQTVDKIDKIGKSGVTEKLIKKGLDKKSVEDILRKIENAKIPDNLKNTIDLAVSLGVDKNKIEYQPYLARGLDYYTGIIFEGKIDGYSSGSVGGGGRYDNLIKDLGGPDMPSVGFAVGFDRTLEALEKMDLLPDFNFSSQVLVTIFNKELALESLNLTQELRNNGIKVEVYPEFDNLGKQIGMANEKNIPFVVIVGPNEIEKNLFSLKNMETGEEETLKKEELINKLK